MALLNALAVLDAGEVLAVHPESATLRQQLPLFVGAADAAAALWWFVLTDESGTRRFVFVAAEGSLSICMVSSSRQPTPMLSILASLIRTAAADGASEALPAALPLLCGALLPPPPGAELELRFGRWPACRIGSPAAPLPAADGLLLDVLSVLGLEQTLRVWSALLLERPVLLLSDSVPLLSSAAEGLVALLAPLRWEGTYVPVLPARLVEYVEAPTPFLMGASRRLVDSLPALDLSAVLVADLDRGALRPPTEAPPPLPCDGLAPLEPLAPLLVGRASAAARLRAPAAAPAAHCFAVAQRCFLALLKTVLRPDALRSALRPRAAAGAPDGEEDGGVDWGAYVAGLPADARAHCDELRGTLLFEGLVAAMLRGETPIEEAEAAAAAAAAATAAEGGGEGGGEDGGEGGAAAAAPPRLRVALVGGAGGCELDIADDDAEGAEGAEAGAAEAASLDGLGEGGWRRAAAALRGALEAANAEAVAQGSRGRDVARRAAACVGGAVARGAAASARRRGALRALRAGYLAAAEGAAAALLEYDAAARLAPGAVAEGTVAALLRPMARAELESALAALAAAAGADGGAEGGARTSVAALCAAQLASRAEREAAAAAAAERARRRAEAPPAAPPAAPPPPPPAAGGEAAALRPAEGAAYNSLAPTEPLPEGGAVAVAAQLLAEAAALFRAHADADGLVGRAQLLAIRDCAGFAALARRTGWLRDLRVAPLGGGARLALWLNVYNLLLMHGYVLHAAALNRRQRAVSRGLRIVRLHSRFVYAVGGELISAVEIEHALLRRETKAPPFPFSSWLLPKFAAADPRAALAPPPCALLAFGLVAGTPFSPPLRPFGAGAPPTWGGVLAELEENARRHLGATAALLPTADGRQQLRLPAVLQWHMADLGADTPAALRALLPLLPAELTSAASAAGAKVSFAPAVWDVRYEVGPAME